ncbi:MAG: hypothetical protein ABSE51_08775 [Terracidiphilus sp.]|jgi:hypothetical protein
MNEPLCPLSLAEILDRTFHIYRTKFLAFAGLAAIPALAMMVIHSTDTVWLHLRSHVHSSDRGGVLAWNFIISLGFYHVSSFLGLLILPASVKLASEIILGENGTLLFSLFFVATRWRSYLLVAVLKISAQLVIPEILMTALLFGAAGIEVVTGDVSHEAGILAFLVVLLLVAGCIPFVWLGACLSLTVAACALEGITGIGVLRRSWSLSKGGRFRVIFAWLMVVALGLLLDIAVRFLFRWSVVFPFNGNQLGNASQHLYVEGLYLLYATVSAFVSPVYSIATTLIYYDQRIRHEGYDVERMMEAAGLNAPVTLLSGNVPEVPVRAGEGPA